MIEISARRQASIETRRALPPLPSLFLSICQSIYTDIRNNRVTGIVQHLRSSGETTWVESTRWRYVPSGVVKVISSSLWILRSALKNIPGIL